MHSCKRMCPGCGSNDNIVLHRIPFSSGDEQEVSVCKVCGMGYASLTPLANYEESSIYAAPEAIGSGDTPRERERFCETVDILSKSFPDKWITVLDVGCAQGGLLAELGRQGYEHATGMDPSQSCVDACIAKGLIAVKGKLDDDAREVYDLVILSHVLEHVWDIPKALASVRGRLKDGGHVYVEVPDASRYAEFLVCPFLDFNSEHINHFSLHCLGEVMRRAGFYPASNGMRNLMLASGKYPAIYIIARMGDRPATWLEKSDTKLAGCLEEYVERSREYMKAIDMQLGEQIGCKEIILWGYGEFAQQLFLTQAVRSAKIVQVIDRDRAKQRKMFKGLKVEGPEMIHTDATILIASVLNKDSIKKDIQMMQLKNNIITLPTSQ
jgi:SAM-dependent methyltransferase